MKPTFYLYELDEQSLQLSGEIDPVDLDVNSVDELIQVREPLTYDLTVQQLEDAILVQGKVRAVLACECARCLRPFPLDLEWPDWTVHLPLTGEDSIKVDGEVDLTPFLREDTLLRFPQHPLCEPECGGLAQQRAGGSDETPDRGEQSASVWSALNQLKLK